MGFRESHASATQVSVTTGSQSRLTGRTPAATEKPSLRVGGECGLCALCGAGVARRKMRHSSSFVDSNPAQSFGLSIRSAMPPKSQSPRSSSTSARPSRLHKQNSWLCLTNRTTICVYSSPRPRWSFSHALRCSQVVVAWRYEFLHKFVCRLRLIVTHTAQFQGALVISQNNVPTRGERGISQLPKTVSLLVVQSSKKQLTSERPSAQAKVMASPYKSLHDLCVGRRWLSRVLPKSKVAQIRSLVGFGFRISPPGLVDSWSDFFSATFTFTYDRFSNCSL